MSNQYYKRTDIINKSFYKIPGYIEADFSGIQSEEIEFKQGDRLDIIAAKKYGNSGYWRAIALFNNIAFMFDPQPGDIIRLPRKIQQVIDRI